MNGPKYFEVQFDSTLTGAWFLQDPRAGDGKEIDARSFTEGVPYWGPPPVQLPIFQAGHSLDFHLASFEMPVVSPIVADILSQLAPGDIELFPVMVEGHEGSYSILNVVHSAACLDLQRSDVLFWQPEHGDPDRVGEYLQVTDLTIDPSRVPGYNIFRILGLEMSLIVSQTIRDALVDIPKLGVVFKQVVPEQG